MDNGGPLVLWQEPIPLGHLTPYIPAFCPYSSKLYCAKALENAHSTVRRTLSIRSQIRSFAEPKYSALFGTTASVFFPVKYLGKDIRSLRISVQTVRRMSCIWSQLHSCAQSGFAALFGPTANIYFSGQTNQEKISDLDRNSENLPNPNSPNFLGLRLVYFFR